MVFLLWCVAHYEVSKSYMLSFQVVMWLNQNFLLQEDIIVQSPLLVKFMSLRAGGKLVFKLEQSGQVRSCDVIVHAFLTFACPARLCCES